jgi:hypothetical protein
MRGNDANRAVAELAATRHGAYSRRLAASVGFTKAMAAARLRRGDLTEPVPGVLVVAGTPMTYRTRLSIVVQAAGGTVASHRSAALLHGFDDFASAPLEVTVPRGRYPEIDDVIVHRAKRIDPCDITTVDGIPVTSVARTLCDLGAVVDQDTVERSLDCALRRGCSQRWIEEVHARVDRPGPSGTATLGRILDDPRRRGRLPDSWLERLLKRASAHPELPEMVLQHEVRDPSSGRLVAVLDGCFPDWMIGVEGHSKQYHGHGTRREWSDLERDNAVGMFGYEIVYVTWTLANDPDRFCDIILRTYRARQLAAQRSSSLPKAAS